MPEHERQTLLMSTKRQTNKTCEHLLMHFLTKYMEKNETININNDIKIADIQFARVHRLRSEPTKLYSIHCTNGSKVWEISRLKNHKKSRNHHKHETYWSVLKRTIPARNRGAKTETVPNSKEIQSETKQTKCTLVRDKLFVENRTIQ